MTDLLSWFQDNALTVLGLQLLAIAGLAGWLLASRLKKREFVASEPAKGDRRTVVLPEEDAAQMFETLTALQEELDGYRRRERDAEEARLAQTDTDMATALEVLDGASGQAQDDQLESHDPEPRRLPAAAGTVQESAVYEQFEEMVSRDVMPDRAGEAERATVPAHQEDEEASTAPPRAKEEPTPVDRILREWLDDIERLSRRARRDAF